MKAEDRRIIPLQAQKMEVIGRLASAIIHDLNNLLTVIQLNAALIETADFDPEEVIGAAGKIGEASQRAADLTRKVLGFVRRQPEDFQPMKIRSLFDGLVRLLEPLAAKKVEIGIVAGPRDHWVRGDRGALEQAILNLVLNAVDAMPSGGKITLSSCERDLAAGEIDGCPPGPFVTVCVSDSGCGIPPEDQPMVFEPFFTSKSSGTGMGLAIVAQVARSHGGAVDFDSEPGRGTEFRMWIPEIDPPLDESRLAAGTHGIAPLRGTILLVEDDPGIRDLARQLLQANGLRVLMAATGEEAQEIWSAHRGEIQLLFTDLVLPGGLSGRDVALAILTDQPDLSVLYTSGFSSVWSDHSFLNESNFLPKPFHPTALRNAVMTSLARS
ncbi:MAG: ATP-binding protein [Terrimicrobiaceae bacterium]|nr:ATP-binding protein [Terrimicrobiaceae bacterium]